MPRHKNRRGREVSVGDFWSPEFAAQAASAPPPRTHIRGPIARRTVDPLLLRRAFMLQNFQFILRFDLLSAKASQGLPQGLRRLLECLRSSDSLIPWEAVHSVVLRGSMDEFQCPICLDAPIAPRITECGHVYCLPCMLQYLHVQKLHNQDRTCPVCHNLVATFTLRPCVFLPVRTLVVGQASRFDLFMREPTSSILRRYDDPHLEDRRIKLATSTGGGIEEEVRLPFFMEPCAVHCRYVLSTPDYNANHRYLDAADISRRLRELEDYVKPLSEADAMQERFLLDSLNEVTKDHQRLAQSLTRVSPPLAPRPHDPKGQEKLLEVYAAGEGQPYYLHMLSVKMLRHDAALRGTPMPETVLGRIEEITSFQQDEETRRIYKAFAHVPLHGTVKLCMLDLTDTVLPATLEAFRATLDEHSARRRERQKANEAQPDDVSWREYLQKYNPQLIVSPSSPSATFGVALSDVASTDAESVPFLQLPSTDSGWSSHGLPPNTLETRQCATKRQDLGPDALVVGAESRSAGTPAAQPTIDNRHGCWSPGSSAARLFKTAPSYSNCSEESSPKTVSTWGGHDMSVAHNRK